MSKVSRSDWSATAPWEGIIGKPSTFGVTDIGQLTGIGFSAGQVPRWNGVKFVPYTIPNVPTPTPDPTPLPDPISLTWDIPELFPLQTGTEDFNVNGVFPSYPLALSVNSNPGFFFFAALVTQIDTVTLYAVNMSAAPVTLGSTNFSIQRFQ